MKVSRIIIAAILSIIAAQECSAAKLTTLFSFNFDNGYSPSGLLAMDRNGNLFGTTSQGGAKTPECQSGCGTVFELSPPPAGKNIWTQKTLASFRGSNGNSPVAGVIFDKAGNLYGTTSYGGNLDNGTVFELKRPVAGTTKWTLIPLTKFNDTSGKTPNGGLVMDSAGILYGTTARGGPSTACNDGCGGVFELLPPTTGTNRWARKNVVNFNGKNGNSPTAGLIMDRAGNFYGTSRYGGGTTASCTPGCGNIFKLSPPAPGGTQWKLETLANFSWSNDMRPTSLLAMDSRGNLFGTTAWAGPSPVCSLLCGTVFELIPPANGTAQWTLKTLKTFNGKDGYEPFDGLVVDRTGSLYGTTYGGGVSSHCPGGCGTIFKLTPPLAGATNWNFKTLVNFDGGNGVRPRQLIMDDAGDLYGATEMGGYRGSGKCFPGGCGTVFKLTP